MKHELPQNYVGTKWVGKKKCSSDPNEHTFIDYKDLCGNYPDRTIQLEDKDPFVALDSLFYSIVDFLDDEFSQEIDEERNVFHKKNYELVKKHLKAFSIIKEKKIDSRLFTDGDFDDYHHYLERMCIWNCCDSNKELFEKCWGVLAEEEFNLLKEALE